MKTLDEIREEVQEKDKRQFDRRVAGVRKKVYDAIESFGMTPGVDYEEGLWILKHEVHVILARNQITLLERTLIQGVIKIGFALNNYCDIIKFHL